MPRLKDQQKQFAHLYVKYGFDKKRAAIDAGYSAKSADSLSSRLLKKPQIKAEIDRLCARIEEKTTVEAGEIIKELRGIAFAKPHSKTNTTDKIRSLELLGKYLTLWSDKVSFNDESASADISPEEKNQLKEITRILTKELGEGKSADDIIASLRRLDMLQSSGRTA